jgi:uncharacterized membrane protein HdeD (DUF308 family)
MKLLYKILGIVLGVALISAGITCFTAPDITFLAIGYILGVAMIVSGISNAVTWSARRKLGLADGWTLAGGILSMVFGIVLIVSEAAQLAADVFVAYMAGIWIVAEGILRIVKSSALHTMNTATGGTTPARRWWVVLISGIALVLLGIFSIMNPGITAVALGLLIGLDIIFAGVNLITLTLVV